MDVAAPAPALALAASRFLDPDTPPSPPAWSDGEHDAPGSPTSMDQDPFDSDEDVRSISNARDASSATSFDAFSDDASMRSVSPAPSLYSLTSSILQQGFTWEFGREMNNYSEVYRLPADTEELERLDRQHVMVNTVMGSKYVPVLVHAIADEGRGDLKTVLDLGCGSGSWIMQVARDFPHAQCVAVDLIPMQSENLPPNCRSEVDDINLGLQHFYGEFNVVRSALIMTGIRDYPGLIDELSRVLRPAGIAELLEYDVHIYTEDKLPIAVVDTPLPSPAPHSPPESSSSLAPPPMPSIPSPYGPPSTSASATSLQHPIPPSMTYAQPRTEAPAVSTASVAGPYLPKWMHHFVRACRSRGASPDAAPLLAHWTRQHHAFEGVERRDVWLPVGPWHAHALHMHPDEREKLARVGEMVAQNMRDFFLSARPLLLGSGLDVEYVDELQEACMGELEGSGVEGEGERMYMRLEHVVACRKEPGPPPIPESVLERLSI